MEQLEKPKTNIQQLFADAKQRKTYLKVCAPMVRYSKLEFRKLVRNYGIDLCFTPMIMANSFCQSKHCRSSEFTTDSTDTPLIVQFAAKNTWEYLSAAEMCYPYTDGIDLNCGCPQRWAMSDGYGGAMLRDPQLIYDLVKTIKRNLPSDYSVSVKIRLQKPLSKTIELCRQLEKSNITFVTCHGRTTTQKHKEIVDVDALKMISECLHEMSFIANGDIRTLQEANELFERIDCNGIMSARGILSNPTMFMGTTRTTTECIENWLNLSYDGTIINDQPIPQQQQPTFQCIHHHLTFMMDKCMTKLERIEFNNYTKRIQVYNFLNRKYGINPKMPAAKDKSIVECFYDETAYKTRIYDHEQLHCKQITSAEYNSERTQGNYFRNQTDDSKQIVDTDDTVLCDLDFIDSTLFD